MKYTTLKLQFIFILIYIMFILNILNSFQLNYITLNIYNIYYFDCDAKHDLLK